MRIRNFVPQPASPAIVCETRNFFVERYYGPPTDQRELRSSLKILVFSGHALQGQSLHFHTGFSKIEAGMNKILLAAGFRTRVLLPILFEAGSGEEEPLAFEKLEISAVAQSFRPWKSADPDRLYSEGLLHPALRASSGSLIGGNGLDVCTHTEPPSITSPAALASSAEKKGTQYAE
jgi:hypothetical protein